MWPYSQRLLCRRQAASALESVVLVMLHRTRRRAPSAREAVVRNAPDAKTASPLQVFPKYVYVSRDARAASFPAMRSIVGQTAAPPSSRTYEKPASWTPDHTPGLRRCNCKSGGTHNNTDGQLRFPAERVLNHPAGIGLQLSLFSGGSSMRAERTAPTASRPCFF